MAQRTFVHLLIWRILPITLLLLLLAVVWIGHQVNREIEKSRSEDPTVWQKEIDGFVAASNNGLEPENAVLFVGSSSIRLWSTLKQDMAPLPVIQRGFGGAKMNDVTHYAKELVTINNPRAVVVFAGTNDVSTSHVKPVETILASYKAFVNKVRATQPDLPIYYILITPSPKRWAVWNAAQDTNTAIREYANSQPAMYVLDTGPGLLSVDGTPNPDMYIWDGLHLSAMGYDHWTSVIKPRLLADFPPE